MPFIIDDAGSQLWTPYDEEERRKKKQQDAYGGYIPFSSGWTTLSGKVTQPIKAAPKTKTVQAPLKPGVNRQYISPYDTDRQTIKKFVEASLTESKGPSLTDYVKMTRLLGEGQADARLRSALNLWRTYYYPFGGPEMAWAIADSPFTIQELEEMGTAAVPILFNIDPRRKYNYLSPAFSDGTKDGDFLRGVLGDARPYALPRPSRYDEDVVGGYTLSGEYVPSAYGPHVIMPGEILPSDKEKMKGSIEDVYSQDMFLKEEQWQSDYYRDDKEFKGLVDELSNFTGVGLQSTGSWQEYYLKIDEAIGEMKFTDADRAEHLKDQAAQWYTKNSFQDYPEKMDRVKRAGKGLGYSALAAGGMYMIGGGLLGAAVSGSFLGQLFAGIGGAALATMTAGSALGEEYAPEAQKEKRAQGLMSEFAIYDLPSKAEQQVRNILDPYKDLPLDDPSRSDVKEWQEDIHKPLYDEEGVLISPAYGIGLVADGVATEQWYVIAEKRVDDVMRYDMRLQALLIAEDRVPRDTKITGSFFKFNETTGQWEADPVWEEGLRKYQEDINYWNNYSVDHPVAYAVTKASGIPVNAKGFTHMLADVFREGLLTAPLTAPVVGAHMLGGAVEGLVPAILQSTKSLSIDPKYQKLGEDMVKVIDTILASGQTDTSDFPFDVGPGELTPEKAYLLVGQGYIQDETALNVANQFLVRHLEVLDETSYGWIQAIMTRRADDYETLQQQIDNNIDIITVGNMAMLIGAQIAGIKGLRMFNRAAVRTAGVVTNTRSSKKLLDRAGKMIDKDGDFGNAGMLVGGKDIATLARRAAEYRHGYDVHTPDAAHVKDTSAKLVEHARNGDVDAARKILSKSDDADAIFGQISELVKRYDTRTAERLVSREKKWWQRRETRAKTSAQKYDEGTQRQVDRTRAREREARFNLESNIRKFTERRRAVLKRRHGDDQEKLNYDLAREISKRRSDLERKHWSKYQDMEATVRNKRRTNRDNYLANQDDAWLGRNEARANNDRARAVEDVIASKLVYRQRGKGDIWGTREVSGEPIYKIADDMFSGQDGRHYDILPQLVDSRLKGANYAKISLERAVAGMRNPRMKAMAEAILLESYHAPVPKTSIEIAQYPKRIADWVAALTHDLDLANKWRTKAMLTDFTKPRAIRRFEQELQSLRGEYLVQREGARVTSLDPLLRPREEVGFEQLSGLKLTSEEGAKLQRIQGETREVVMSPTQMKHEIHMGRDILWAERNGTYLTGFANQIRKMEVISNWFAARGRVISVGAGFPILFFKHLNADSLRTLVMQGTSTFRRHKVKKQRTKNLLEGSIEAQRFDAMEKNVTVQTELHYTLDNGHAVKGYVPRKIFTNRGHPKYMAAGIDSIRRIIDNPAYQRYRQDGPEGLDQWLRSPEGIKHLEESGAFTDTRQFYKELDGRTLSKAELHEAGIEIYKAKYELLFDDYAQLKTLNKYMDEIITGRRPRTDREIRRIILDANRAGDNPTVDVPLEGTGKFMSTFARMTRWGMTFNKWNREWVYDHMFNQVYKSQRRAGVGADDAIRIAASSARQRTGQVHFDLSYALKGELQHRYFAWFYTKHRLWSVWLGKAAIKYPGYAGAASELIDWLEKRSEDMNLPEWEKFHLQVGPIKVNFAPYLWLTPYPTESAMGMLGEAGLSAVSDRVFGDDLKSVNVNGQEINILAPKVFDYSFTRLDPLLINMWRAIQAPGGVKEGVAATVGLSAGSDFGTQEEWVEFIEKLPEGDRGAFVDAAVTYFVYHEDEGITIEEACAKVVAGNLRHELLRLMKPASTRIVTDTDEEMQRYMTEYGTLDTEKARQEYLRLHPNFARTIGAGRSEDPWTHMAVQEGWARYNDLSNRRSQEVKKAAANGNLLDPQYSQNIENGFRKDLDELFADIPAFAQAFNEGGMSPYTREQRLNLVFPAISIEGYENMRVPTPDEADIYAETVLAPQYKAACAAFGIPTNSTSLLNKRLKNKYIDTPKALYQKILPGDLAQTVKTNMRIIAMGGGTGARFRATQYMEAVINNDRRVFHLRGVKSGKADTLNLLMAVATPEEKYYYGFPVDEESERIWDAVTLEISQFQERMRSMDLRASATKYKDAKADLMQHIQDTYYGRNEIFDVQYDYSVSDLVTRLELLGYPGYDTPESQGWADAIEIMHEFLYDLSQVENKISPTGYGVTSGAQSAADIQRKHLKRIVALSKENEDWLFQFKLMGFGLSRLGFYSEWKLGDKSDLDLWSLDTPIEEEEYSTQWGE